MLLSLSACGGEKVDSGTGDTKTSENDITRKQNRCTDNVFY